MTRRFRTVGMTPENCKRNDDRDCWSLPVPSLASKGEIDASILVDWELGFVITTMPDGSMAYPWVAAADGAATASQRQS